MGEDLVKGEVYAYAEGCEPTNLGKVVSIEVVNESGEKISESLLKVGEASVTVQANTLKLAKAFGINRINRKRFRKLLYSKGIGRNEANEIIKVVSKIKGYYTENDVRYWDEYINNLNKVRSLLGKEIEKYE